MCDYLALTSLGARISYAAALSAAGHVRTSRLLCRIYPQDSRPMTRFLFALIAALLLGLVSQAGAAAVSYGPGVTALTGTNSYTLDSLNRLTGESSTRNGGYSEANVFDQGEQPNHAARDERPRLQRRQPA